VVLYNQPAPGMPDFSGNEDSRWFALRVRSNFERTVSTILQNKGYEEFLPTYRCQRRWTDRIKTEDLPLFPGYVFCRLDQARRLPVLSTSGVLHIVGIGKAPVAVEPAELEAVWRIVHSDLLSNPWPHLEAGQMVVIEAGPLAGIEGILIESKNQTKLVVSVTLLRRSVAVEIEKRNVRPVGGVERLIGQTIEKAVADPLVRKGASSVPWKPDTAATGGR